MKLFIGLPTYCGQRFNAVALCGAIQHNYNGGKRLFSEINVQEMDSSACCMSFNSLLIAALEARAAGRCDFFLLLHGDVVPTNVNGWIEDLFAARRAVVASGSKCEVLSAVVPIKDIRGVTTTAVEGETEWSPKRYTLAELAKKPVTFTEPNLLVNTGMLLIDLRKNQWIDKVTFAFKDAMLELPTGKRLAAMQPEDWDFSRQCRALGVDVWATRAVALNHRGLFNYPNYVVWGEDVDPGDGGSAPVARGE